MRKAIRIAKQAIWGKYRDCQKYPTRHQKTVAGAAHPLHLPKPAKPYIKHCFWLLFEISGSLYGYAAPLHRRVNLPLSTYESSRTMENLGAVHRSRRCSAIGVSTGAYGKRRVRKVRYERYIEHVVFGRGPLLTSRFWFSQDMWAICIVHRIRFESSLFKVSFRTSL